MTKAAGAGGGGNEAVKVCDCISFKKWLYFLLQSGILFPSKWLQFFLQEGLYVSRSLSYLIKSVSHIMCHYSEFLISLSYLFSSKTIDQVIVRCRPMNKREIGMKCKVNNGEFEDIEIFLSFYDNINRVWLCLSLLHKASSILLVFTVCPHRDPVRVHYISNVWIFWYSQMTSIMIPLKSFTMLLVQQKKFKRV